MLAPVRKLLALITAVERSAYLAGTGALVLVASALVPWATQPSNRLSRVNALGELELFEEAHWTELAARATAFLAGLFVLGALARRRPPQLGTLRVAWTAVILLLTLPCWHDHWATEQRWEKELIFHEMNRITDDMERNLNEQQVSWRDWQSIQPATVSGIPIVKPQEHTWSLAEFAPSHWERLLPDLLGFSKEFLGFYRPLLLAGQIIAVIALLTGLHLASPLGSAGFRRGLAWGIGFTVVSLAATLGPRLVGEYLLVEAVQASARGDRLASLEYYRAAPAWKVALRKSWWYDDQLGQALKLYDRETNPENFLADAYTQLRANNPQLALQSLYRARELAPENLNLGEYIGITMSEAGISAFNAGQYNLAQDFWQQSLQYLPINPMPWYGLCLVHLRHKQFHEAARCCDQLVKLQKYLGFKRLTVRSQAYVMQSWAAFHQGNLNQAHEMYSWSLTPDNW